ncbi:MAG TPA: hypothetical protein VKX41_20355 [Alloacidobacterium sp.]|nr:hypothetical protein [Alloacidobacterium sp.]
MKQHARALLLPIFLAAVLPFLTSCGMVTPPQPPSLYLPQPVTDLTATRIGNEVHLHWTMPKRATDRVLLKGDQDARICRSIANRPCDPAGDAKYAPEVQADFIDHLPTALASGPLQLITYTVELRNHRGKTAGPSNPAWSAAGAAPAPANPLTAEIHSEGVLLRWQPAADTSTLIRIQRTLVPKPGTAPKKNSALLRKGAETPAQQTLEVGYIAGHDPAQAWDKDAAFDRIYRYTAQRIETVTLARHKIEIASEPSPVFTLNTRDIFPPATPTGLVAVASPDEHIIDLSWSPNAESDLAGYIVYRRKAGSSTTPSRISPVEPVAGPAFRDTTAEPGKRYAYSVSAIDQDKNESPRSAEIEESLPQ